MSLVSPFGPQINDLPKQREPEATQDEVLAVLNDNRRTSRNIARSVLEGRNPNRMISAGLVDELDPSVNTRLAELVEAGIATRENVDRLFASSVMVFSKNSGH